MQLLTWDGDVSYLGCYMFPPQSLPLEGYPSVLRSSLGIGYFCVDHSSPGVNKRIINFAQPQNDPVKIPVKISAACGYMTNPTPVMPTAAQKAARDPNLAPALPVAQWISTELRDIARTYYPAGDGFSAYPGTYAVVWSSDYNIPGTPRWVIAQNNYPFYAVSSPLLVQFYSFGWCEMLEQTNLNPQGPWCAGNPQGAVIGAYGAATSFAMSPIPPTLRSLFGGHQFIIGMIPRTSNPKYNLSPLPTGVVSFPSTLPPVRTSMPWIWCCQFQGGVPPAGPPPATPEYDLYDEYKFNEPGLVYHNPFGSNTRRTVSGSDWVYGPFGNASKDGNGNALQWSVDDPNHPGYFKDKNQGKNLGWITASQMRGCLVYTKTHWAWVSLGSIGTSTFYDDARETVPGWLDGDPGVTAPGSIINDCGGAKGYQGGTFLKKLFMMDPEEFTKVIAGTKTTRQVRHYKMRDTSDFMWPTCSGFVTSVDFDPVNLRLYVCQGNAAVGNFNNVMHVFQVSGEPYDGSPPAPPPPEVPVPEKHLIPVFSHRRSRAKR